ncbi:hypothetical protein HKX48_008129 [Thoreauomyces humboldtii]|nr:hypothetical protein HKX48_008129 [Thoreauomyces humboldtii]
MKKRRKPFNPDWIFQEAPIPPGFLQELTCSFCLETVDRSCFSAAQRSKGERRKCLRCAAEYNGSWAHFQCTETYERMFALEAPPPRTAKPSPGEDKGFMTMERRTWAYERFKPTIPVPSRWEDVSEDKASKSENLASHSTTRPAMDPPSEVVRETLPNGHSRSTVATLNRVPSASKTESVLKKQVENRQHAKDSADRTPACNGIQHVPLSQPFLDTTHPNELVNTRPVASNGIIKSTSTPVCDEHKVNGIDRKPRKRPSISAGGFRMLQATPAIASLASRPRKTNSIPAREKDGAESNMSQQQQEGTRLTQDHQQDSQLSVSDVLLDDLRAPETAARPYSDVVEECFPSSNHSLANGTSMPANATSAGDELEVLTTSHRDPQSNHVEPLAEQKLNVDHENEAHARQPNPADFDVSKGLDHVPASTTPRSPSEVINVTRRIVRMFHLMNVTRRKAIHDAGIENNVDVVVRVGINGFLLVEGSVADMERFLGALKEHTPVERAAEMISSQPSDGKTWRKVSRKNPD